MVIYLRHISVFFFIFVHNNNGDFMIVRLGYVSISRTLENIISFHSITYTKYCIDNDINKIDLVVTENFKTLISILNYNKKNNIHFYRLTSKLIPLATHDKVKIDYIKRYRTLYQQTSLLMNDMRIDVHPDQFAVLNSTKREIVNNTIKILMYHYNVLKAMKIKNPIIILHVGSSVLGKKNSISRFINNFNLLPKYLQKTIALENDDKVFNIKDVLYICKQLDIPFVFDYHHYRCNNDGENYEEYIDDIFATWKGIKPKIHFSSPKNKTKKDFRSHSEYINCIDFINFIEVIKKYNRDVDIMLEAKGKDEAIFKLTRQLKFMTNYHFIDDTTFKP